MSTKLYVGNLSFDTNEADLTTLFGSAGEVREVAIVNDRDTGRSRGFGFVTMADAAGATAAIAEFNGREHDGRRLTVNEARPMESRGGGNGGGGGQRGFGGGGGGGGRDRDRRPARRF